ncbi:MAG: LytTR family DNA-binding domain-containing protein [Bacteroidota bacterium]
MITAIIIDDIAQARATLREDLQAYCPEVQLIGEAEGVVSGVKLLQKQTVDVLFLDIQMQDGSGFDLLEMLPDLDAQVIFTTASDAFAIKAFRFSAVDYLLKPIDPDELIEAVKKVEQSASVPQKAKFDLLLDTFKAQNQPKKLALHTQEKIHITDVKDIIRCESTGNYTIFHFQEGPKLMVTKTLKEYDQLLQDQGFVRVHQSHLVNQRQIQAYIKLEGGYLLMNDDSRVPVSLRKKAMVMKLLDQL